MFTIEQIKTAHSKVKSGADFPAYVQDMKKLGILNYEHFVTDGHIRYAGVAGYSISGDAKWPTINIATQGSPALLKQQLKIHQQGETDYPTFCKQSAAAGVEKWIVDMEKMTCTYYDSAGNELLVEHIPMP